MYVINVPQDDFFLFGFCSLRIILGSSSIRDAAGLMLLCYSSHLFFFCWLFGRCWFEVSFFLSFFFFTFPLSFSLQFSRESENVSTAMEYYYSRPHSMLNGKKDEEQKRNHRKQPQS